MNSYTTQLTTKSSTGFFPPSLPQGGNSPSLCLASSTLGVIGCIMVRSLFLQSDVTLISIRSPSAEHIWWDQGTAMVQAGILPPYVPYPLDGGKQMLRLPAAGIETARMLVDETDGTSNEMFGSDWGVQDVTKENFQ